MKSNGFEEMLAIQLAVRSWPGQAKRNAEELVLKDGEVPETFYLGNEKIIPSVSSHSPSFPAGARNYINDSSYPLENSENGLWGRGQGPLGPLTILPQTSTPLPWFP